MIKKQKTKKQIATTSRYFRPLNPILNRSGQGLVSILVAAGIGATILGFIADMMLKQGVGQKFLTQKIVINDLSNNLSTIFSKPAVCTCQFANNAGTNPNFGNFANLKFNSAITDGSQKISVGRIYTGCLGGANAPLLVAQDGAALPTSPDIIVDKVTLENLRPTGALNEWQGQWQVSFVVGNNSVVRSVRPLQLTQKFTVDATVPANTVISACNGLSTGTGTNNFVAKWTAATGVLQDSSLYSDDITGNVGIADSTPSVALDVGGGIRPGSSTTVTACGMGNANGEGTTRYNYTTHTMEFCDGTSWVSMGGGSPPGTMCGLSAAMGPTTQCQGLDPSSSCPSSYTQFSWNTGHWTSIIYG